MSPKKSEKLTVRKYPDSILLKKTKTVKNPLEPAIRELIPKMIETMRAEKGVGLAANQVGIGLRLCVIEEGGELYVMINPEITAKSKQKVILEEGCLSLPGQYYLVPRHEKIKARYLDESGKKAKIKASGLLAQALQHELDHLDGIILAEKKKIKRIK